MTNTQNTCFGTIVYVNAESGTVGVETRMGERLLIEANKCHAVGLEVAVHMLDGRAYSIESIADWADIEDESTASYRVSGLA